MLPVYHKIPLVERLPRQLLNALETRLSRLILRFGHASCHRPEDKVIHQSL
jgi:hypothetical protein